MSHTAPVVLLEDAKRTKETSPVTSVEMTVYFGSQTGTAAAFAKTLVDESAQHGVKAKLANLGTFSPETLAKERLVVFVISTYGRGGPTDNSKKFYKWLIDSAAIKPSVLKDTMFCVFGCGDKGFKYFNKMAKDTTEKILARGAKK